MSLVRATVLTVYGDPASRNAITRILEHANFRVRQAATASECLLQARKEHPDLILLHYNLPDLSACELCRRLKSDSETCGSALLLISEARLSSGDIVRALAAGVDQYIPEPLEPEVLVAAIQAVLRTRGTGGSALQAAREWQAIFDAIRVGIALVDTDGRIRRANDTLGQLLERPAGELLGMSCTQLWGNLPSDRQPFLRALESGHRETLELEYHDKDLSVAVDPICDDRGDVTGAVHIVSDVTEQRRLEDQFRESQKFETIGTLAAGVAHDFNNLLTSIMGNTSLVLSDLPPDSRLRERLDDVVRSSQRAADLTRQLLAYSGKGRHYMQRVELSSLVRHIETLIEAAVPKKISLEFRLAERLPHIEADVNQLQQVVLNLVSNAAEAIGDASGGISISTGQDREWVYLEVRDSGCGMDAETRARIFDPFFTTKFTGRGLGLAAVAGIVRSHKGNVQVNSSPGEGSTFRIAFACAEAPAALEPPAAHSTAPAGGTILVVDDEEVVRRIAEAALEVRGFRVVAAANGLQAIRQVREDPSIDLVLLDLTMPVMGGEEAIDQILEAHPGIQVLVSTGYDHQEAVARFSRKRVAGYLQKPYTARQLADKVQALMQKRAVGK